ncbi:hypothetical protein [Saccharothrix australiensis]|uniref:Uncharacterized protein n=1 Tax=Saccharothrix australiensis TaxID=2072 RepID=A0A495W2J1_9PSEU|nr:hypothetical protein [Saccharothrix australiensis]RKT55604.1 hypothetical protein C8E97_4285 [Saccharothrix australiensis]
MEDEVRRARDEVVNMIALRPEVASARRRSLPRGLLWRDLWSVPVSGALDVLTAAAVIGVGPDTWLTKAAGFALGINGANALVDGFHQAHQRARHVARLREHGPDPADTLAALRADKPRPRLVRVLRIAYELALFVLPATALFQSHPEGVPAWTVVVAALVGRLSAAALVDRYARRGQHWEQRFIRLEGIALPPLPDRWRVLVTR